jgi:hypothetical protein
LAASFPSSFAFQSCLTDIRGIAGTTEYTERTEKK